MYYFLLLCFLSGFVELGAVYFGIQQKVPLEVLIIFPLFYQFGNLMMNYVQRTKKILLLMGTIGIGLFAINVATRNYYAILLQLTVCSFVIQAAREGYKKKCPTWLKRSFRIIGFALSPLMLLAKGQLLIILATVLSIVLFMRENKVEADRATKVHKKAEISFVMVFHQLHYFVYTYIMPVYIYGITKSFWLSSISFAITWIVYLLPQTVAEKKHWDNYTKIFFVCHTFLALCLLLMTLSAFVGYKYLILVGWLLTGLGGGSVFCIKHLSLSYEHMNMELSENIGHVIGPICASMICFLAPKNELLYLTLAAFVFVLISIIDSAFIVKKETLYE